MYNQIADACFLINGSDDTITIENVLFVWDGVANRDLCGAQAVVDFIRASSSLQVATLQLLWVSCRKDKDNA
jgi:hypothetical protein